MGPIRVKMVEFREVGHTRRKNVGVSRGFVLTRERRGWPRV